MKRLTYYFIGDEPMTSVNKFRSLFSGIPEHVLTELHNEAEKEMKDLNLNVVCIRFDASAVNDMHVQFDPIFSNAVNNLSRIIHVISISRRPKYIAHIM